MTNPVASADGGAAGFRLSPLRGSAGMTGLMTSDTHLRQYDLRFGHSGLIFDSNDVANMINRYDLILAGSRPAWNRLQ
jgi:hypothetical protein